MKQMVCLKMVNTPNRDRLPNFADRLKARWQDLKIPTENQQQQNMKMVETTMAKRFDMSQ